MKHDKDTLPTNVVWYENQKYGTDGDFIYRFDQAGKLSRVFIYDKWLSDIGKGLAEKAKKHW